MLIRLANRVTIMIVQMFAYVNKCCKAKQHIAKLVYRSLTCFLNLYKKRTTLLSILTELLPPVMTN